MFAHILFVCSDSVLVGFIIKKLNQADSLSLLWLIFFTHSQISTKKLPPINPSAKEVDFDEKGLRKIQQALNITIVNDIINLYFSRK
jgi:hypothetical protein